VSLTRLGIYRLWGENPERMWKYLRPWSTPISRWLAPGAGYGGERLPATGGVVLASNHFAGIDPSLIGSYCPRVVYYMAKIELLSVPIVGELLRWTGAFAVRRGEGDRDSLRMARWVVRHGHVVGMFMEGTRQRFGYPGPAHPGAVMVAMQEGVPIVPCGIDSFGWTPRNRRPAAVVFGDPIRFDDLPTTGRGYKEGAAIVEKAIHRLWRLAAQAVHDDFPDVLPDGTRRSRPIAMPAGVENPSLDPWPTEDWAEGPLGPVYRPSRP
jgi:1-acyl-sn-glycerol-3-phosphate acyltransferase